MTLPHRWTVGPRSILAAAVLVSFASGCTNQGSLAEPPLDVPAAYTPDWDGVVALMNDHCVSCHQVDGDADFLVLPLGLAEDLQRGNDSLVVPFDPEASRLWRMIGGDRRDEDVADMPVTGRLDPALVDHVRLWIESGAPHPAVPLDDDEDGVSTLDGDCDDADPTIHPDAEELCDGLDNDCDGVVDGDTATGAAPWYPDLDGDGYGDSDQELVTCDPPEDFVTLDGDCDDTDADFRPGALETDCRDASDYNCDGEVLAVDADADGSWACDDCDDADPQVHPEATEVCDSADNDCDGAIDEDVADATPWYRDNDGDGAGDALGAPTASCEDPGAGWSSTNDDCDDTNASISPLADELCDGADNDCDGTTDVGAIDPLSWYPDADSDGYGANVAPTLACDAPTGSVALSGDCDDSDAAFNPGEVESDCADLNDYNCDGSVGAVDGDGDGYFACQECDDTDPAIFPGATEVCDGADNDCDGGVDAGATDAPLWYPDVDGDGYGDANAFGVPACVAPALGWLQTATDCDDDEALVSPVGVELCDGLDNDCDGSADVDALDRTSWYLDADGDGYGGTVVSVACTAPADHIATDADCDDGDAAVSPAAPEVCDGADNDCDGGVDVDATDAPLHYPDLDGDGDGDWSSSGFFDCATAPPDSSATNGDCDDTDAAVHAGADELCDTVDNDCDGAVDEAAVDAQDWYPDGDGDGYGDASSSPTSDCSAPSGSVADNTDCDDSAGNVNPGAPSDYANGIDDDCDGQVDEDGAALSSALDIQPIWDAECLGACHQAPMPSSGMELVDGYAALVGVASADVPSMPRVTPFSTADSYLWHKLNGTQVSVGGAGNRMPSGQTGPPSQRWLSADEMALVEQWILSGANP